MGKRGARIFCNFAAMEIVCKDQNGLPEAARQFVEAMGSDTLFAFYGEMGAGKTTFISEVCRVLGAVDEASSPTFNIVNDYPDANGESIFHFDFYRLDTPADALELGLDDYFYSGRPCFMEWPERIGALLPTETVKVTIDARPDGSRVITL